VVQALASRFDVGLLACPAGVKCALLLFGIDSEQVFHFSWGKETSCYLEHVGPRAVLFNVNSDGIVQAETRKAQFAGVGNVELDAAVSEISCKGGFSVLVLFDEDVAGIGLQVTCEESSERTAGGCKAVSMFGADKSVRTTDFIGGEYVASGCQRPIGEIERYAPNMNAVFA
jgi:hypothetical protein